MKKFFLMILVSLPLFLNAQQASLVQAKKAKKDRVQSEKIAFITKELDLTSEEAQKFWPVYNQYTKEREELRKQRRESIQVTEQMTDADAAKAIENMLSYRQKELDLQKEYITRFQAVLPGRKVAKLYNAEEKFKRVLLDRLNKKSSAGTGMKHRPAGKK